MASSEDKKKRAKKATDYLDAGADYVKVAEKQFENIGDNDGAKRAGKIVKDVEELSREVKEKINPQKGG